MGTSTRNHGRSGHTPLIPTWLDEDTPNVMPNSNIDQTSKEAGMPIPPNADPNRFKEPRKDLTQYASGGGRDGATMRRGVSRYVRHSLGGSLNAVKQLGSARRSTARLYNILNTISDHGGIRGVERLLSLDKLEGLSANEFFVKVLSFVCPDGGLNEEGVARSAYIDAILDNPDIGDKPIEELTPADIETVLKSFMVKVIMQHLLNDIASGTIQLPAGINTAMHIEDQIEQLIMNSVSDAFAAQTQERIKITSADAQKITDGIYQNIYRVLEGLGD